MRFSEGYKKLCIKNQKMLRDQWKKRGPQEGDWFYNPSQDKVYLLTRRNTWFIGAPKGFIEHNIPLPSQRQLQEILEERGHRNYTLGAWENEKEEARYLVQDFDHPDQKLFFGLDPETALLRALVEVMKGG